MRLYRFKVNFRQNDYSHAPIARPKAILGALHWPWRCVRRPAPGRKLPAEPLGWSCVFPLSGS